MIDNKIQWHHAAGSGSLSRFRVNAGNASGLSPRAFPFSAAHIRSL
jgi:hypothetical protein